MLSNDGLTNKWRIRELMMKWPVLIEINMNFFNSMIGILFWSLEMLFFYKGELVRTNYANLKLFPYQPSFF